MTRTQPISKTLETTRQSGLTLLLIVWLASGIGLGRAEAAAQSKEYQVKAALLLNFAHFIQWPETAFAGSETPFTVGVLGDDPFGATLDKTFQGESIQGRGVAVKRSHQIDELKACQLLFVSTSENSRLTEVLASLGEASVVTVSETDGFADHGGIINFYINNSKKVRFEINAHAAHRKGLKINSQLLKRAKIVGPDPRKEGP